MSRKLPPYEGKRVPLNMKTTKEVRALLEAAARLSGRSLTAEVEHRVLASLHTDHVRAAVREEVRAAFGEARLAAVEPDETKASEGLALN